MEKIQPFLVLPIGALFLGAAVYLLARFDAARQEAGARAPASFDPWFAMRRAQISGMLASVSTTALATLLASFSTHASIRKDAPEGKPERDTVI
ncbi:hypothetical protein [Rhizobium sp.]